MKIEPKFNIDQLFSDIGRKVNTLIEGVIEAMVKTCLEITTEAKQLNTYQDRTNNLRSSIGYVVYERGEKKAEHFTQSGVGAEGTGADGIAAGKAIAAQAATEYPNDIVGVIVAGADYALYVESKGLDVLTGPCTKLYSTFEKNLRLVFGK